MTSRFARMYQKVRDRLGGRAKLALAIVGIWIAFEIIAAVAVVVLGAGWLTSGESAARSDRGGLSMSLYAARTTNSSIAII